MFKEFKQFAFKGNVVDMAVGVMIGGAFGQIVSSAVNDLFMPLVSLLTGGLDFSNLFIAFDGGQYPSLAAAKEAGAACFAYGSFLTAVLDFLIMALCIFLMVKGINSLRALPKKAERICLLPQRSRAFALTALVKSMQKQRGARIARQNCLRNSSKTLEA